MSSEATPTPKSVVALLWTFAFLSYLLRMNITVAQQYIARDFSFNAVQIGAIFTAFLIGYSLFQIPGGLLGDKWGPRWVLGICALVWGTTTALTGFLPGRLWSGTSGVLLVLIAIRFLHGLAQAATYPVAMTAVSNWFPPRQHAVITSLIFTGSTLGSAFAPPVVSNLMTGYGWRATFYLTALPPFALAFLWLRRTRGLKPLHLPESQGATGRSWWQVFRTRNVFFLCLSYFLYCYAISIFVYWLFKYLVDVRHLSIVNSGWVNSLPWIVASIAVPIFGFISSWYSGNVGFLKARRRIASGCLLAASILLFVGAQATDLPAAIGAISLSVGLLFSTESSYFSTAIELAGRDAGAASGLMNLAGNLGGVTATSAVPLLVIHYGWLVALVSGSVLAALAALTWAGLQPVQVGNPQNMSVGFST